MNRHTLFEVLESSSECHVLDIVNTGGVRRTRTLTDPNDVQSQEDQVLIHVNMCPSLQVRGLLPNLADESIYITLHDAFLTSQRAGCKCWLESFPNPMVGLFVDLGVLQKMSINVKDRQPTCRMVKEAAFLIGTGGYQ